MANTLITLKNASLAFGDYPLLDNTDFSVQEGERIGLIGRNGHRQELHASGARPKVRAG